MKRTPQTAEAYARYLYMAERAKGESETVRVIVDSRVRAFADGVNWQKRRARKAKPRTSTTEQT